MLDAHSVNIRSKPYHYGDLRIALIGAGMDLLDTRAADDLSLREVARKVGVSANAVYRHFPDKGALLCALATEGLRKLAAWQREAAEKAGGGTEGFKATGRAYVEFAVSSPALFRMIFSQPAGLNLLSGPPDDLPDAMALLRANAEVVAQPGSQPDAVALRAWSLVHGLAMLILDKQVSSDPDVIDSIFSGPSAS